MSTLMILRSSKPTVFLETVITIYYRVSILLVMYVALRFVIFPLLLLLFFLVSLKGLRTKFAVHDHVILPRLPVKNSSNVKMSFLTGNICKKPSQHASSLEVYEKALIHNCHSRTQNISLCN